MIKNSKNLIIVYKDQNELSLNMLKKLIDTNDDDIDNDVTVGTEDGTVKIIAWNEKTWIDNKKAGNTGKYDDKVLFIGNIKGVDKLIPTLDIKYNEYGVSYGFSGKQAAIMIDPKALIKKEEYDKFIEELKTICNATTVDKKRLLSLENKRTKTKCGILLAASALLFGIVEAAAAAVAAATTYAFGDAKTIKSQQMLMAVTKLYYNDLDSFMKN